MSPFWEGGGAATTEKGCLPAFRRDVLRQAVPIWADLPRGTRRHRGLERLLPATSYRSGPGVVSALLCSSGVMRKRWKVWLLITLMLAAGAGWGGHSSQTVRDQIWWLATQPRVETAFDDEGGGAEALIVLLSFVIVTPVVVSIFAVLLTFAVKVVGAFFYRLRLPEFVSVPVVMAALVVSTYTVREAWLPGSLYLLGLVARAYLVFSSSVPVLPH
jgi:hypothetical protein